ncbi:hypothetical protein ET445_09895 [Agromyces protaetiae]|uniref:SRPBCC family protein n=1 Tax=Agromyces protaetiae TaxID=2509455 RepID=A0A4P6FCK1_9MICO|nr:hypothetical protein [Agromyces protaetiae]QAY73604.1 hypothetical protein ET445_09895 [Agromyces protaetiae]
MTHITFHMHSSLDPAGVFAVLTDFSSARPEQWPSIDAEHFVVHDRGPNWAEVTEGTEAAWERSRYDWDASAGRVVITTHESKVFGEGGGWVFDLSPEGDGTRIDVELTRVPKTFGQKAIAALLPLVGPSSFKRSFAGPLKAA